MFTEITGNEIQKALTTFRERIKRELKYFCSGDFQHPGGKRSQGRKYKISTDYGLLSIVIFSENEDQTKYLQWVDLDRIEARDSTLRLNISKPSRYKAKASTFFARKDNKNSISICHKGSINMFRQPLRRAEVIDFYDRHYGSIINIDDTYKAIKIGDLESDTLFEEIACFAKRIESLKASRQS